MKTKVSRRDLYKAVSAIKGLVRRDKMGGMVKFDVVGPNISITASDGEAQITYRIKGETEDDGCLALSGKMLADMASALPDGGVDICHGDDGKVHINGVGGVKFKLGKGDLGKIIAMKGPEPNSRISVQADVLSGMIGRTAYAASRDEITRRTLCGVYTECGKGKIGLTATDGKCLAHTEMELDAKNGAEFSVIIPSRAVAIISQLLNDAGGKDVDLISDGTRICLVGSDWTLTTTVFDGVYPNWKAVVPKMNHKAKVTNTELLAALSRVSFASDNDTIKMTLATELSCLDASGATATATSTIAGCSIEDGSELNVYLSGELLRDALSHMTPGEVEVGYIDGHAPVTITGDCGSFALVMPKRIS